jgi:hypothetical protein
MLASAGGLTHGHRGLSFHDKPVKVFGQQHGNSLGHGANYPRLDLVDLVENGQRAVLKDRVSI